MMLLNRLNTFSSGSRKRSIFNFIIIMYNRQTPFQQAGSQSFFHLDPMSQFAHSSVNQFMNDYDQFRPPPQSQTQRPRSRELDLMNLLLIGSMDKGKSKSGLEGLNAFLGAPQDTNQLLGSLSSQQSSAAFLPQPSAIAPPSFQPSPYLANQQPGDYFAPLMQRQVAQQFPLQPTYQQQAPMHPQMQQYTPLPIPPGYTQQQRGFQPFLGGNALPDSISPPSLKNNGQLIVNGQMGVNVDQGSTLPPELAGSQQNRILAHIQKQNEVLEQLTKNMATTREQQIKEEKQRLMERMKQLEQLNQQDAYYNNMFDEQPTYKQPQARRLPPPPPMSYNPYSAVPQNPPQVSYPPVRNKQQTLHMLMLIKQMRDMKAEKIRKRKNKEDEVINADSAMDSFTSPSEESVEYVQKPRVVRPKPPPPPYDPAEDLEELKRLQRSRAQRKLKTCTNMVVFLLKLRRSWQQQIEEKRSGMKADFPRLIQEFTVETESLFIRICKDPIETLMKQPKINLQIVSAPNKKISESTMKTNVAKLKEVVKQIFDRVVDNCNELNEKILTFLALVSHDFEYVPDSYFVKFELNRLNFNYQGNLKDMNQNKQFMIYCTHMLVRILLVRIFTKLQLIVQGVQVTEQMKTNIKTAASVVNEVVMMFVRGYAAIQDNNMKDLPIENAPRERKDFYFQLDQIDAMQEEVQKLMDAKSQKLDEPLLFPLFSVRQMAPLFDNERIFVNTLVQMVEGWCEVVGRQVNDWYDSARKQHLDQKNKEREEQRKQYGMRKDRVNQVVKQRWENHVNSGKQIEELKARIKEQQEVSDKQQMEYKLKLQQYTQYGQ